MGLNAAVRERLREMDISDELTKQVLVHISGCPNGCGQHHIGNIGFTGASLKVGGPPDARLHPALGGNTRRR